MSLADAAVQYIQNGWSILALIGKVPNSKYHPQGLHQPFEPTAEDWTPEQYNQMDSAFDLPTTGIAIVLPKNVVVVDIDGDEGWYAWSEWAGIKELPSTPIARTAKGLHIWYHTDRPLNRVRIKPLLDFKGLGGYVVVPPSQHPDFPDRPYVWVDPLEWGQGLNLAEFPANVLSDIEQAMKDRAERSRPGDDDFEWYDRDLVITETGWRVVSTPPARLLSMVADAKEGSRNAMLNNAAWIAANAGVPKAKAKPDLVAAAAAAGLVGPEVARTIDSAYEGSKGA